MYVSVSEDLRDSEQLQPYKYLQAHARSARVQDCHVHALFFIRHDDAGVDYAISESVSQSVTESLSLCPSEQPTQRRIPSGTAEDPCPPVAQMGSTRVDEQCG